MTTSPIRCAGHLVLALCLTLPAAASGTAAADEPQIVHVLNRLGFGPRPGDVVRIRALGLERWIEQQLHPERLDQRGVAPRLAGLTTLDLSPAELMKGYDIPREVKRELQKRQAEMADAASEDEARRARRELLREHRGKLAGTPRQVVEELQAAKLIRAAYSERQLDEVLVDFWMNHFNVYAAKGPVRFLVGAYERDVIRPHAWGKFEKLLKATAESPAMLFYLDNWLSADPNTAASRDRGFAGRRRPSRGRFPAGDDVMRGAPADRGAQAAGRRRGLNENYAREIMELHTLGVDGGYTQKDITEVARCFTGWTLRGLREQRPEFAFDPRAHDGGDKLVLGHKIRGGGKDEGDQVIHLLATHPNTARFVSYKLARRLVADEPPQALVDRAARVFRESDGDIRAVVRSIVTSPELLGPEYRTAKVKTPFEFVVSAVRASGAEVRDGRELARRLTAMGMPLYLQQPPTGYKDTADAWVSTSGLLARLNFALDLMGGRVAGASVDPKRLAPGADDAAALSSALAAAFLPSGLSAATRATLDTESGLDAPRIAGLLLGSPEFQRR